MSSMRNKFAALVVAISLVASIGGPASLAAQSTNLRTNGQRITLLAPLTITAAVGATGTTPVVFLAGMTHLVGEAIFVYGSGGTNATAYIQTSLDGGTTWVDIICFQFTTASLSKVSAVTSNIAFAASAYVPIAPTDGALTANTSVQGILGDRVRLKYVTTGTYAASTTLAVYAIVKAS